MPKAGNKLVEQNLAFAPRRVCSEQKKREAAALSCGLSCEIGLQRQPLGLKDAQFRAEGGSPTPRALKACTERGMGLSGGTGPKGGHGNTLRQRSRTHDNAG